MMPLFFWMTLELFVNVIKYLRHVITDLQKGKNKLVSVSASHRIRPPASENTNDRCWPDKKRFAKVKVMPA